MDRSEERFTNVTSSSFAFSCPQVGHYDVLCPTLYYTLPFLGCPSTTHLGILGGRLTWPIFVKFLHPFFFLWSRLASSLFFSHHPYLFGKMLAARTQRLVASSRTLRKLSTQIEKAGPLGADGRHEIWREGQSSDHDNEPRYVRIRTKCTRIPSRDGCDAEIGRGSLPMRFYNHFLTKSSCFSIL
jgi:hypothetical protein